MVASSPFKSPLTGQTAQQYCDAYEAATGKQWTQPLGFKLANLEVAIDALKRAKKLEPSAIRDAIATTDYQSIVGPITWKGGPTNPVPNVCTTPLVGGSGKGQEVQVRPGHRVQQDRAQHSARRSVRADQVFLNCRYVCQQTAAALLARRRRIAVCHDGPPGTEGVSKFYGALKAVDGVKLVVNDGEALGVIGPNGAGKSTMFNLITGDAAPRKAGSCSAAPT